jgi:hexosaminidase
MKEWLSVFNIVKRPRISAICFMCGLLSMTGLAQDKTLPLIPWADFRVQGNTFTINSRTVVCGLNAAEGNVFVKQVEEITTLKIKLDTTGVTGIRNAIYFGVDIDQPRVPGSYDLLVDTDEIQIIGGDREGMFHGLETLVQLVGMNNEVQCGHIYNDFPRYSWRGMHLDVCRHFFSKQEVEKYLDYLALYKFNVFHWHLCDDQGWRIEIKKYPKLTEIGSKRKQTMIGKPTKEQKFDGKPYGGFYTQEDIKEIVAYATARHITVVPEIEMPGHSLAALAAYPQYSCTGGPFEVGTTWGVFDDVYCAGNDSTFAFLQDILSEVCELFPGRYIHIGGDECPKVRWKVCPKCQKRIKDMKLKDEHELQSYFIQRMEQFLNSKGKQIIGWDEILEGGLAPNASVMSWRGTQGGIDAARQGHFVVMTPGKPCYFDHYQSKSKTSEPLAIGGFNPLDSVYNYEPTPKSLSGTEREFILGAQGNVWTEYITTFSQVEYMCIPRMCALSEVLWTQPEKKNYNDFISRLLLHKVVLDKMKVHYAKHFLFKK